MNAQLIFRQAIKKDVPELVDMLADDVLGAQREDNARPIHHAYKKAFAEINDDPNNELIVVEQSKEIIGMLQLTFIPYLNRLGSRRCLIEGVRIKSSHRGQGIGHDILSWAIERAKQRDCVMIQLTSDKQRGDAIRFYEQLGFIASHEGLKKNL
ncbi:GNAT family N-acetyltransferase [Marinicella sp. W31]|uniref:GNAT family N-acetyltransferase n=1 Tax=Marinicella sp. W31 TaxID=3023713 RepID=UPI003756DE9F